MAGKRKYTSELLASKIKEYFANCLDNKKISSKSGLALYLDLSREALGDYESKYEETSDTIKRAYLAIEEDWVQNLRANNVAGTIFYLKNAFKEIYKDRQETEYSGNLTLTKALQSND